MRAHTEEIVEWKVFLAELQSKKVKLTLLDVHFLYKTTCVSLVNYISVIYIGDEESINCVLTAPCTELKGGLNARPTHGGNHE